MGIKEGYMKLKTRLYQTATCISVLLLIILSGCSSSGSYQRARQLVQDDYLIPANQIRVDEYLQGHEQGYLTPNEAVALYPEPMYSSYSPDGGTVIGEIGVKAGTGVKEPVDICLVLDRSGSMSEGSKIPLLKSSVKRLVSHLTEIDRVVVITFETKASVLVGTQDSSNRALLMNAIENLTPTGSTDMASGLDLGFRTLNSLSQKENRKRCLILITDAMLNTGTTEHEAVVAASNENISQGVNFTAVGVGDSFNDAIMRQLSSEGGGNYYFIDSEDEASRIFDQKIASVLFDSLKQVKMTIRLEKGVQLKKVYGFEATPAGSSGSYQINIPTTLYSSDEVPVLVEVNIAPGVGGTGILSAELSGMEPNGSSPYIIRNVLSVNQSNEEGILNEHVYRNVMIAEMAFTFQRVWNLVQAKKYADADQEIAALKFNFARMPAINEDPQLKQDWAMILQYEQTINKISSDEDMQNRIPRDQDPLKPVPNP
jgi:uncharacterized protein YegL